MSSEESLATRLRPGVMNHARPTRTPPSNFQEELMRLIDPDISEKDLALFSVRILNMHCKRLKMYTGSLFQTVGQSNIFPLFFV